MRGAKEEVRCTKEEATGAEKDRESYLADLLQTERTITATPDSSHSDSEKTGDTHAERERHPEADRQRHTIGKMHAERERQTNR